MVSDGPGYWYTRAKAERDGSLNMENQYNFSIIFSQILVKNIMMDGDFQLLDKRVIFILLGGD